MLDNALWSGNAHPALAARIASCLDYPLWPIPVRQFPDSETAIEIPKMLKAPHRLVIVQSLCAPVNHHLMELLLMIDAAHRTGCKHITVLIPYFAYAREDNSAKLIADLLAMRPIDCIITLDLHHSALENFFSISLKHIHSTSLFAEDIQKKLIIDYTQGSKPLIVSPDAGGAHRAQKLASSLNADFIALDKKALKNDAITSIKNRFCIIVDDMTDTGKTLCNATCFLKQQGSGPVLSYATHAVLSNNALEILLDSNLDKLILTNTIPLSLANQQHLNSNPDHAKKLEILSVITLLAEAISSD